MQCVISMFKQHNKRPAAVLHMAFVTSLFPANISMPSMGGPLAAGTAAVTAVSKCRQMIGALAKVKSLLQMGRGL